jgi:hypothetical protein
LELNTKETLFSFCSDLATTIRFGYLVWNSDRNGGDNLSIDLFGGCVILLSVIVAGYSLWTTRQHDQFQLIEDRRKQFILDKDLKQMRMLVEHNDLRLQTVIAIINITKYRTPGILTNEMKELHEELDCYLSYLDGIAAVLDKGSSKRERQNLWSYYCKRLRKINLLARVSSEHHLLIDDINSCIDDLYENNKELANKMKNKFADYQGGIDIGDVDVCIFDPIEKEYLKKDIRISPIDRPIWFYINTPEYEFEQLIKLCTGLYGNNDPYVKLSNDGI